MPSIEPVVQFVMDTMHDDATLVSLCDNQIYTGLMRTPVTLVQPHYTRVGVEYVSDSGDGYYFTQTRDMDHMKVSLKVTVVSGLGDNDKQCRLVTDEISNLFAFYHKYIDMAYRIFIDGIESKVEPTDQGRWIGTVTMIAMYYIFLPEGLT